jgi:hypothetical protein
MTRTTIMADDAVVERLREAAQAQRRSLGDVIREALQEKVDRLAPPPRSLGHGSSGGRGPAAAEIGDLRIEPAPWRSS